MNHLLKYNNIVQKVFILFAMLCLFLVVSCEKDDEAGKPIIERIRFTAQDSATTSAKSGDVIAIIGQHFATTLKVYFNDYPAFVNPIFIKDNTIIITVPADAPFISVNNKIRVVTKYGEATADFSIIQPVPSITSFTPLEGTATDTVIITGKVFDNILSVSFGKRAATVITSTDKKILVKVPEGVVKDSIIVVTKGGTATSEQTFKQLPLAITDFTPLQGMPDEIVTITGTAFNGLQSVSFGSVMATVVSSSNTQIKVKVPTGFTQEKITVTTKTGNIQSTATFTKVSFSITGFSPKEGLAGDIVTITGVNFQPTMAVTFGGLNATVNFSNLTEIKVVVPNGVTQSKIILTNSSGTQQTAESFTPLVLTFTDFTPKVAKTDEIVTITGILFNNPPVSVSFGSTPATIIGSPTDREIKVKVPAGITSAAIKVTTNGGTVTSSENFVRNPLDYEIYTDAIASGWWLGGYGNNATSSESTTIARKGTKSYKFTTLTDDYTATQIGKNDPPLDLTDYKSVKFSVYLEGTVNKQFKLYIKDLAPGAIFGGSATYQYFFTPIAGQWNDYTVDFTDMANPPVFNEFVIQNPPGAAPATIYIDEIGLVKK